MFMGNSQPHAFGQKLAKLRQEKNLSQQEFGSLLGISRGMVAYYESCAKNPTIEFVEKVASTFGVTVAELLGELTEAKKKAGPQSRLERLTAELANLPKAKQEVVIQMLEGVLSRR